MINWSQPFGGHELILLECGFAEIAKVAVVDFPMENLCLVALMGIGLVIDDDLIHPLELLE